MTKPTFGCGKPECGASTCIADCPSFGSGELDDQGFWEHGCYACARAFEKAHPEMGVCWPFSRESLDKLKLGRLRWQPVPPAVVRQIKEDIAEPLASDLILSHDTHKELLDALKVIADEAERASLVQDRSVRLIKQVCAGIAKDANAAIAKAEKGK